MHELKIYIGVMFHDNKKLFKIDMRNFTNFDLSTQKSQKFVL